MRIATSQLSMPFLSPAVASHTFPEHMGAWNSIVPHRGEIRTADGRVLAVSAKLSDTEFGSVLAVVNGKEIEIATRAHGDWHFKGDLLAQVISAAAIDQTPALFIEHEQRFEAMRRESRRRERIETKKILRDMQKRAEQGGAA